MQIQRLEERLGAKKPRQLALDYPEAAILVPLREEGGELHILFTQRASHLNTHRGQVAFPGGKRDKEDGDLLATALRESREEIGLDAAHVRVIGGLNQVVSRYGILVTPFVGVMEGEARLTPNLEEIDSIFQVPVSFFLDDKRLRTDTLSFLDYTLYVPCYRWQEYEIWGLSAIVLVDLLNTAFDAEIDLLETPVGGAG